MQDSNPLTDLGKRKFMAGEINKRSLQLSRVRLLEFANILQQNHKEIESNKGQLSLLFLQ